MSAFKKISMAVAAALASTAAANAAMSISETIAIEDGSGNVIAPLAGNTYDLTVGELFQVVLQVQETGQTGVFVSNANRGATYGSKPLGIASVNENLATSTGGIITAQNQLALGGSATVWNTTDLTGAYAWAGNAVNLNPNPNLNGDLVPQGASFANTSGSTGLTSATNLAKDTFGTTLQSFMSGFYTATAVGTTVLTITPKAANAWEDPSGSGKALTSPSVLSSAVGGTATFVVTSGVVTQNPIVSLTPAAGGAPAGMGGNIGPLNVIPEPGNGLYQPAIITGLTTAAGYSLVSNFTPATDQEVYLLKLNSSADDAKIISDINTLAGANPDGLLAEVPTSDVQGLGGVTWDIELDVSSPGAAANGYFGFNLGNDAQALADGIVVNEVLAIPEPTSLGLLALGCMGLLARRRRQA